jgi:hypothetical protein
LTTHSHVLVSSSSSSLFFFFFCYVATVLVGFASLPLGALLRIMPVPEKDRWGFKNTTQFLRGAKSGWTGPSEGGLISRDSLAEGPEMAGIGVDDADL